MMWCGKKSGNLEKGETKNVLFSISKQLSEQNILPPHPTPPLSH